MGFVLAGSEDLGNGEECISGPTFQGLVVVLSVEDEAENKKGSFVQTGPLNISIIAISQRMSLSCEWYGVN